MDNIGNKVFASALWILSAQWVERLLGLISMVILARLLLPYDYGIAALAQAVVLFFQIILSDGTEAYLIRKTTVLEDDYNTAWTVRVILFIFIGILLYNAREFIARFMEEPILIEVLSVSALSTIVTGFRNVGLIQFQKDLNYKPLFFIKFYQKLIGFTVSITIALIYKNYWALILGLLAFEFSNVALSYVYCSFRPKFTLVKFHEQWSFTKWLFVANISIFIRNKSISILVPKYIGASALGMYAMAYELANIPYSQVVAPIVTPVYASYTSVRHDKNQFSLMIIKVISIVSIILMPLYMGMYILAEDVILLLLGKTWVKIQVIFDILLLFVFVQAYIYVFSTVLGSLGRVKLLAILNWLMVLILLPVLFYAAIYQGVEEIVIYRTGLACVFLFIFLIAVHKNVWLAWRKLAFAIARPSLATIVMIVMLSYFQNMVAQFPFWITALPVIIGAASIYTCCLVVIWVFTGRQFGGEEYILDKVMLVSTKARLLNWLTPQIQRLLKY